MQAHVDYGQIDWVARQLQREGHRPLIVLHSRHLSPHIVPTTATGVVRRWQQEDLVFSSPRYANDDWYWMYISVALRVPLVVTNDILRDHHFKLLSPRWFARWCDRHLVRYSFGEWATQDGVPSRRVLLATPPPFSHRTQKTVGADGAPSFYFPQPGGGDIWWCATTAPAPFN